jgi:hypothetical protein
MAFTDGKYLHMVLTKGESKSMYSNKNIVTCISIARQGVAKKHSRFNKYAGNSRRTAFSMQR